MCHHHSFAEVSAQLAELEEAWACSGDTLGALRQEARALAERLAACADAAQAAAAAPSVEDAADAVGVRVVPDAHALLAPLQQRCAALASAVRGACSEDDWWQYDPPGGDDLREVCAVPSYMGCMV